MEPNYHFRSYKEYLPESYQEIFNDYWKTREHTMIELVDFLKNIYDKTTSDKNNWANVAEAMYACCEFFFYGESGGYDEPGNNEKEYYLIRYREGIEKISNVLSTIFRISKGETIEYELRSEEQLWRYLGWKIEDQQKILG